MDSPTATPIPGSTPRTATAAVAAIESQNSVRRWAHSLRAPPSSAREKAAATTIAARVGIGNAERRSGASTSRVRIAPAPTSPVTWVRAPALNATAVRDTTTLPNTPNAPVLASVLFTSMTVIVDSTLNPSLPKTNYLIGQSLIRLNRFDEAEKAFAREFENNPSDYLAKYHLALTLIERKIEPERTIAILQEAVALKPDYADARYQLGKIFLERGETDKAIKQLESAVSYDANKDYIHYQLSIAYRRASRKEDADRELKRYQELKEAIRKTNSPNSTNDINP